MNGEAAVAIVIDGNKEGLNFTALVPEPGRLVLGMSYEVGKPARMKVDAKAARALRRFLEHHFPEEP